MRKIFWMLLLAVLVAVQIGACGIEEQISSSEMTLFVGPGLVDCQGGPQGKCYQVKYSANDEGWVNFAEVIQGFEWEAGYEYELLLKVTESRPRNSDFIFRSFELIDVVGKTKAE